MREIKFRFYSNVDKKMYQLTLLGLHWIAENDPCVYKGSSVDTSTGGTRVQRYSDGHLMQFTGLRDKNGKEIYEGDIVKHNGTGINTRPNPLLTITFVDGAFCITTNNRTEDGTNNSCTIRDMMFQARRKSNGKKEFEMEIIGNIHESPELLVKEAI